MVGAIGGVLAACGGGSPTQPSPAGPRVTAVSPTQGPTLGGTTITISGTNFAAGTFVSIGGTPATNITLQSPSTISAVTPAHVAGAADVVVTLNGQSGSLRGGFTYVIESVTNQPPKLVSLVAKGTRPNEPAQFADVDEKIAVTATVTDQETPISSLIFDWSADAGSFSGNGPSVSYTAPHATGQVTLRLKITETYTAPDESGLPVQKENTTFGTTTVDVHDSVKEVGGMAKDFLVLFSQSSIPAEQVVHNFLDGCGAGGTGKQDELAQTTANRTNFLITAWKVGDPKVTINFDTTCAYRDRKEDSCTTVDVDWHSTCRVQDPTIGCPFVGATRHDVGVDWVTAKYDAPTKRWWLCDSDYEGQLSTSFKPYLIK
jgi:hypothetical protein